QARQAAGRDDRRPHEDRHMTVLSAAPAALKAVQARLLAALPRMTAAIARSLPADTAISAGVIDDGTTGREHLLPGANGAARAVSASLDGNLRGTLVLAVSAPLAEAIEHGPVLDQELVAGLVHVLADAVAVLEEGAGGPVRIEAAHEVDANVAFGATDDGATFLALTVLDGTAHVATL